MKKCIAILLFIGVLCVELIGCGKKDMNTVILGSSEEHGYKQGIENPLDTEGTMLFDYYKATIGVEGEPYREITLNAVDDYLYVNVYEGSRSEGTTTMHKAYIGTTELYDELYDAVERYEMLTWNGDVGTSMTGVLEVVKFIGADGDVVRVSSENMPNDGEEAFSYISGLINEYLSSSPYCVR